MTGVLFALVLAFAVERFARVSEAFIAAKYPAPVDGEAEVPIPEDLVALAMREREAWAQEDVLKVIRERYADLQDWNRVRAAMGVGTLTD